MIRLRQIKKSFRDKSGINEVLRGISLGVMKCEFVAIMALFQKLDREGTTIIQVTHSEFNAGFGKRVLHIFAGRTEEPEITARNRTTEEEQAK